MWVQERRRRFEGRSRRRRADRNALRPGWTVLEDRRLLTTFVWISPSDGTWNNPANWRDPNGKPGVPGAGDLAAISPGNVEVRIDAPAEVTAIQCDASLAIAGTGTLTVANLTPSRISRLEMAQGSALRSTGGSLAIGGGAIAGKVSSQAGDVAFANGTTFLDTGALLDGEGRFDLPVKGAITVRGSTTVAAAMALDGGTINGGGRLTLTGALDWTSGIMGGDGTTAVSPGGSISLDGWRTKTLGDDRVLSNYGTIQWSDGSWDLGRGAVVNNYGTLAETGSRTLNGTPYRMATLNNQGTLRINAGANGLLKFGIWAGLNNTGKVEIQSGTLEIDSDSEDRGAIDIAAGAMLDVQSHRLRIDGPAPTFTGAGILRAGYGGTIAADTAVRVANLVVQIGTFGGSGAVTVTNSLSVNVGGTLWGSGSLTVAPGARMSIATENSFSLNNGYTLVNEGLATISVGRAGVQFTNGSTLDNRSTLRFDSSATFDGYGSHPSTLKNSGTLIVAPHSGTELELIRGVMLVNSGTVDIGKNGSVALGSGGANTGTVNVQAGASFAIEGGTFVAGGRAPFFGGPGRYELIGGQLTTSSATRFSNLTILGGTLDGRGPVTVNGALRVRGGTLTGPGSLTVLAGGTMTIDGIIQSATIADGYALVNNGEGTLLNPGRLRTANGGVLRNTGRMTARDGDASGAFHGLLANTGTLDVSIGRFMYPLEFASQGGLWNAGTVNVLSGRLELDGGMTNSGTVHAAEGARVLFKGGTSTFHGGRLNGKGSFEMLGGQMTVATTADLADLTMTGGTIDGPGTATIAGEFDFQGGTLSGPGRLKLAQIGRMAIKGPETRTVSNGYTLELDGITNWTGQGTLVVDRGAVVDNRGSFSVRGSVTLGGDGGTFNNWGSLGVSTGARGVWNVAGNDALNNAGMLGVGSGTLELHGGGTETGMVVLHEDGRMKLDAGTLAFLKGSSFGGPGALEVAGGTFAVEAPLGRPNLVVSGGTVLNNASLNVTMGLDWSSGTFTGNGTTTVAPRASEKINGTGPKVVTGNHVLVLGGSGTWSGGGTLNLGQGAVVNNEGTLKIVGPALATSAGLGGIGTFNNYGTLAVDAGAGGSVRFADDVALNNFDRLNINGGTLALEHGGTETGRFHAAAGAALDLAGGTVALSGTATTLSGPGRFLLSGGELAALAGRTILNLDSGAALNWVGGRIRVPTGSTLSVHGGQILPTGAGNKVLGGGGTLEVSSPLSLQGAGNLVLEGSPQGVATTLRIAQGAVLTLGQGSGIASGGHGGGTLVNAGRIDKNNASTTTVGVPLDNTGTIDLANGILAAQDGFTQRGGGTLDVVIGGTDADPTISGLRVHGNVTLAGRLSVTDPNHVNVPIGGVLTLIDNPWLYRVNGTFDGLPEGAALPPIDGMTFAIHYGGGLLGRNVVLKRVQ